MLLTDKYTEKIYGMITCYDRMIIQGYILGWSHAEGMTSYLNANHIRIFDFPNFSQSLTEQKSNSSASSVPSAKMNGARRLSTKPGRPKD